MIDTLTALRLQLEWGADEALAELPLDRFAPKPSPPPASRLPHPRPAPQASTPAPQASTPAPQASTPAPQASTIDALYAQLDALDCPLRTTATHTVRPAGDPAANLVLVGDAPGSDDDRSGQAFSGAPGRLLDRVLGSIGLHRKAMLLTTLVPWRPPGGRKLSEAEIQLCLPFLHRLLALVQPRHLVLLGAAPVRALTGESDSLRRLRGRWLKVQIPDAQPPMDALCLQPIDLWLRNAATKQELWADLIRLRRAVNSA